MSINAILWNLMLATIVCVKANQPDAMACCQDVGVPAVCRKHFCDLSQPPRAPADDNLLPFLKNLRKCKSHLPRIFRCLTDGRNNSACCRRKSRSCFDLCDASETTGMDDFWPHVSNFMVQKFEECVQLNIGDIYQCYLEGYERSPSVPQDLNINVLEPSKVRVNWSPPEINRQLVDHYSLKLTTNVPKDAPLVMATTNIEIELPELRPDTKYSLTVVAVAEDGDYQSLPTEAISFVTNGVIPTLIPYQDHVDVAIATDAIVVCKIEVMGWQHKDVQVFWEKRNPSTGEFNVLYGPDSKYGLEAYVAAYHRQPRIYISALTIRDVTASDMGVYQCTANNTFGKGASTITIAPVIDPEVPSAPPNTTECCQRAGVSSECLSSCTDGNTTLPSHTSCILDATKILGCSMSGRDMGACCLRQHVPTHCLSFCDGTLHHPRTQNPFTAAHFASNRAYPHCIYHTQEIYSCIEELSVNLPETPRDLSVSSQSSSRVSIRWHASGRAQQYHVYYRFVDSSSSSSNTWNLQTVLGTDVELNSLKPDRIHEVVVVASNDSGQSGPSKTLRVFTGRIQRDLAMPFDTEDVSARFRSQQRLRGASTGRLMEEHFDS